MALPEARGGSWQLEKAGSDSEGKRGIRPTARRRMVGANHGEAGRGQLGGGERRLRAREVSCGEAGRGSGLREVASSSAKPDSMAEEGG